MLPIAGTPGNATANRYPTYRIGSVTSSSTVELIQSFDPDVLLVACFPRLIPRAIRAIPRLTALNIHPSLLPAHRGPDPLFWIMHAGGAGYGVTVHALSGHFDTGNILAQRALPYPDGARESDLELMLASVGAELAANVISTVEQHATRGEPQNEMLASYESWPTVEDFVIDTNRYALQAWNFIRGVAPRGVPVRVKTASGTVHVSDALARGESDDVVAIPTADQVVINFQTGWLLGQLHHGGQD